jgi:hypothetical protein
MDSDLAGARVDRIARDGPKELVSDLEYRWVSPLDTCGNVALADGRHVVRWCCQWLGG